MRQLLAVTCNWQLTRGIMNKDGCWLLNKKKKNRTEHTVKSRYFEVSRETKIVLKNGEVLQIRG